MERQLINALLAIAAVSAESGLLVVNRFALSCKPAAFRLPPSTFSPRRPLLTIWDVLAGTYK